MVFSVVVNNDKRWYTVKLLVSLEIPRGSFPYEKNDIETPGEGGVLGVLTSIYHGILGCTAVQGMVLDLSALNREKG